ATAAQEVGQIVGLTGLRFEESEDSKLDCHDQSPFLADGPTLSLSRSRAKPGRRVRRQPSLLHRLSLTNARFRLRRSGEAERHGRDDMVCAVSGSAHRKSL